MPGLLLYQSWASGIAASSNLCLLSTKVAKNLLKFNPWNLKSSKKNKSYTPWNSAQPWNMPCWKEISSSNHTNFRGELLVSGRVLGGGWLLHPLWKDIVSQIENGWGVKIIKMFVQATTERLVFRHVHKRFRTHWIGCWTVSYSNLIDISAWIFVGDLWDTSISFFNGWRSRKASLLCNSPGLYISWGPYVTT